MQQDRQRTEGRSGRDGHNKQHHPQLEMWYLGGIAGIG